MNAFVTFPDDAKKLKEDVLSQLKPQSWVICEGVYELSEGELAILRGAETIYFVASSTSMCSSAYQALVLASLPLLNTEKCRLLKLDDAKIPVGFRVLQEIPEAHPLESLHN